MKIVEFLLNNLLPIFFAVLCLIAALKSIEIVKRSEVELMTKRRKEIEFVYETLIGWGLNLEKTYSFKGEYLEEQKMVVFSLKNTD